MLQNMEQISEYQGFVPMEAAVPSADEVSFIDIPDEILSNIAHWLLPPDAYSLCLTSKHFHKPTTLPSSPEFSAAGGNAPGALLGTRLMRASLWDSLERVLKSSKAGLSSDQTKSFSRMASSLHNDDLVLISGSSMAQVALGEKWGDSDLDIYCTPGAAPTVRSWLVSEASQVMTAISEFYLSSEENFMNSLMKASHHVELYVNRPQEGEIFHELARPFVYNQACLTGKEVNERWFSRGMLGDDYKEPPYKIETLPGVPLPFDHYLGCYEEHGAERKRLGIDLIVGKFTNSSAEDVLEDFDINICKCAWNGSTFKIPDPHRTFMRRSVMANAEKMALVECYQRNLVLNDDPNEGLLVLNSRDRRDERIRQIRIALERVQEEGVLLPAPLLSARDANWRICQDRDLQLHNYVANLFLRIKKYVARGIILEGLPKGAVDYLIRGVMSKGYIAL